MCVGPCVHYRNRPQKKSPAPGYNRKNQLVSPIAICVDFVLIDVQGFERNNTSPTESIFKHQIIRM